MLPADCAEELIHRMRIAHITSRSTQVGTAQFPAGLLKRCFAASGENELAAFSGESVSHRKSDAAGAACDQSDAVREACILCAWQGRGHCTRRSAVTLRPAQNLVLGFHESCRVRFRLDVFQFDVLWESAEERYALSDQDWDAGDDQPLYLSGAQELLDRDA